MKSLICGVFTLLLCMSSVHASTPAKFIVDTGPFGVHSWFLKGIKDGAFSKRGLDIEFVGKAPAVLKLVLLSQLEEQILDIMTIVV